MAAILACGGEAVLSHGSAAAATGIGEERDGRIHASVPAARNPRAPDGIVAHRRSTLSGDDVSERAGIPVTGVVLTLIDLAATEPAHVVESAVNDADKHDLIDPGSLRRALDSRPSRPGVRSLRELLDRHTLVLTDSELERRLVPIALRAGLGVPLTQQWLHGFRVDFHWPDLGLVVETDGLRYHRTPAQQARDRRRDQAHAAAGLTALRFTHAQVRYEAEQVETTLRRVATRLGSRTA